MIYSHEVEKMCPVAQGVHHGAAPCPTEGNWVQYKEIKDISGLTHGIGWCAPQQGACKLTLNVKEGIIEEAGKDHLVMSDPNTGNWQLILLIYLNFVEFDERINYSHSYSEKTY